MLSYAVAAFGVVLTLVGEAIGRRWLAWIGKPLASAAFVAFALQHGALETGVGTIMLIAFVLSWLGDVLLISKSSSIFLAGLTAFLLAHVAFAAAFLQVPQPWAVTSIAFAVLAVLALLVVRWLWPHLKPTMRAPVIAYVVSIVGMCTLAIGAASALSLPVLAIGAMLFFVSDLFVARNRFVKPGLVNRVIGLPLYYTAQFWLASLIVVLQNV